MRISASLVLYRSRKDQYEAAIKSFLDSVPTGTLYVVDNSPEPLDSDYFSDTRVHHMHNGQNIGFGAAHNRAIRVACHESDLHLILNPDIQFGGNVLDVLSDHFNKDANLAVAMPKVVYPDGSLQRLCKLLPTPNDLIARRFLPFNGLRQRLNRRYEMHDLCQEQPSEVPTLSGCFLVIRSKNLLDVGGFDERYFMYMEDVDLVRRLALVGKALYIPTISVVHEYAKGSYKNRRLLGYHIKSAIRYFNKWGWFFDKYRKARNDICIKEMGEVTR